MTPLEVAQQLATLIYEASQHGVTTEGSLTFRQGESYATVGAAHGITKTGEDDNG